MDKNKLKNQSNYSINLKVNGEYETLEIVQEENVIDRNAIKIEFYKDRWRTPEDTIELLKKIIIVIEKYFLKKSDDKI